MIFPTPLAIFIRLWNKGARFNLSFFLLQDTKPEPSARGRLQILHIGSSHYNQSNDKVVVQP